MKRTGWKTGASGLAVLTVLMLWSAGPAAAGVVDGHVYADLVSCQGTVVLHGEAVDVADALAVPGDGKYIEIRPDATSGFSLKMQFSSPALYPSMRVWLAPGTTSWYFTVQGFMGSFSNYRYALEGISWTGPYDVPIWYSDTIDYVEVKQRQLYAAGVVYIDAIEATNIPPVVSAGPDLTITLNQQATTVLNGTISDSYGYSTGYVWQKNGVSLTGWNAFRPDGTAPLDLSTLAPLAVGTYTFKLITKDAGTNRTDEMILTLTSNQAPVADPGGPYIIFATSWEGASVTLDGSGSSDPDGDSLSYTWDFTQDETPVGTATGVSPEFFFPYGTTEVKLTISDGNGGSHFDTTTLTVGYRAVVIDVKPGDSQNVINMGSNGVIPVAFLSSATFDSTTINPALVALRGEDFSSGLVRMRGKNGSVPQATITDVDGDGLADLLVHIETEKLADQDLQTKIELGAQTWDGEVVLGQDTLTVLHQE